MYIEQQLAGISGPTERNERADLTDLNKWRDERTAVHRDAPRTEDLPRFGILSGARKGGHATTDATSGLEHRKIAD